MRLVSSRSKYPSLIEALETRQLLSVTITDPIDDQSGTAGTSTNVSLTNHYVAPTTVRLSTSKGDIDIVLTDTVTPKTVENFLAYVNANRYDDVIAHRLVQGFVLQLGGYDADNVVGYINTLLSGGTPSAIPHITEFPTVDNEFQSGVTTNVQWTVAMAKKGGDPDSAQSEFFINLADNRSNLDNQNGGFTTFGRISTASIPVVQAMAAMNISNGGSPIDELPTVRTVAEINAAGTIARNDLIIINDVTVIPTEVTYEIVSDNNTLVSPVVSGDTLTLNYGAGQTGTTNVNVVVRTADGLQVMDAFLVAVAAPGPELDATIGEGGTRKVVYTETDGTVTTLSLNRGSGTLHFVGDGLLSQVDDDTTTITGTNIVLQSVDLSNTDGGTLSIKTSGTDRSVTIGSINSTSPLSKLTASNVSLSNASTLGGAVGTISLSTAKQLTVLGDVRTLTVGTVEDGVSVQGVLTDGNFGTIGSLDVNSARTIDADTINGSFISDGEVREVDITTINGPVTLGSARELDITALNDALTVLGELRTAKFGTINGDVNVNGTSRSFRVTETLTGNLTFSQNDSSIRIQALRGNLTVNGTAKTVTIADALDSLLTFGGAGSGGRVTLTVTNAVDVAVTSAVELRTVKTDNWTNFDGDVEAITAPAIGSLTSKAGFSPALTLDNSIGASRALSSASIKGEVGPVAWNISGNTGSISATAINAGWTANVTGEIRSLKVSGDLLSDFTAGSVRTLTVNGSMNGVNLSVNGTSDSSVLRTMTVKGAMIDSVVRSTQGNIGTVSVGSMSNSKLLAGTVDENFADALDDFNADLRISKVTVKKGSTAAPTFSNSIIQARHLGSINIGTINPGNDVAFGVAADDISSITGFMDETRFPRMRDLADPSQGAANGTFGAFEIRVL